MEQKTISASRVAAMLGVSPYQTPLSLYFELRGELGEQEDNELLEEGREFEAAIAKIACRKFGFELIGSGQLELSYGPLSGHLDFVVRDETGRLVVLEIKHTLFGASGDDSWGEPGSDQVPRHYWLQDQTYTHLLKRKHGEEAADYGYLAARLRRGVTLYKVNYDRAVCEKLEQEAWAFLARVEASNPPDAQDEADARRRWSVEGEKVAVAGEEQMAVLRALAAIRAQKKALDAEEANLALLVLGWAQDAGRVVSEGGEALATLTVSRRFDAVAFAEQHPDIAARHQRLDSSLLGKEQRKLYEAFMRYPPQAEQTRAIKLAKALKATEES